MKIRGSNPANPELMSHRCEAMIAKLLPLNMGSGCFNFFTISMSQAKISLPCKNMATKSTKRLSQVTEQGKALTVKKILHEFL